MSKVIFCFLLIVLNGSSFSQELITQQDRGFHNALLQDEKFTDGDRALLKRFTDNMLNYDSEVFVELFAEQFKNHLRESVHFKDYPLEKAIWIQLPVPSMSWDAYFEEGIENLYDFKDWNSIEEFYFVGEEPFSGSRLFFKIKLKNGKVYGGRIFMHPSGPPNGTYEFHGAYG
ncbi:MAG: hypothetical protein QNK23_07995 [Crocinitomicaceae bacterium]|nr:hypothetical protein [Crocinitomicaceae bacterium]